MPGRAIRTRVRRAVRGLSQRGVAACLVTGRMYRSALPFAKELGLETPLVCYQGATIVDPRAGVLYEKPLGNAAALDYVRYAKAEHLHVQLYADDNYYCEERNRYSDLYARISGVDPIVVPSLEEQFQTADATKAVIIADAEAASKHFMVLRQRFAGRGYVTRSIPEFVEMMNPAVDKGQALNFIARRLNVAIESTMAIGDSWNDEPLLRAAGFAVAMGSAPAQLREAANAVVADCEHDGVAEAIERFVFA
jgi:Cof subfamily protein (haloacid dehalogenase superfamily)